MKAGMNGSAVLMRSSGSIAYASTAGDHNTVSANAQWLLEQKAPEDMTPKERRLAVDLCCIADNYSLLKVLRQLDDKGER